MSFILTFSGPFCINLQTVSHSLSHSRVSICKDSIWRVEDLRHRIAFLWQVSDKSQSSPCRRPPMRSIVVAFVPLVGDTGSWLNLRSSTDYSARSRDRAPACSSTLPHSSSCLVVALVHFHQVRRTAPLALVRFVPSSVRSLRAMIADPCLRVES